MPGSSRRFESRGSRHGPPNVHLIVELLIGLYARRGPRPLQRTLKMAYISHFKLNALRPNNFDVRIPSQSAFGSGPDQQNSQQQQQPGLMSNIQTMGAQTQPSAQTNMQGNQQMYDGSGGNDYC
ncbi:hypothetical protein DdX_01769 [Ditylenchus destructor]|uniref:Uncharacterized protein n=1 Tax=Ditylenchus destructor TaxID=166010 RepID=A0AAD4NL56_9BILA|nr:hypothetical protein DdX_01769 [Ditylenchus destructor]